MDHGAVPPTEDVVVVSSAAVDPAALVQDVARDDAGAVVLFLGVVRDHSPGREGVTSLEYEAYEGHVEREIRRIIEESRERWDVGSVAVAHRLGVVGLGESTVGIAVSAGHRPDAFSAARFLIDEMKQRAPIWKKEHWSEGSEWVGEERGARGE